MTPSSRGNAPGVPKGDRRYLCRTCLIRRGGRSYHMRGRIGGGEADVFISWGSDGGIVPLVRHVVLFFFWWKIKIYLDAYRKNMGLFAKDPRNKIIFHKTGGMVGPDWWFPCGLYLMRINLQWRICSPSFFFIMATDFFLFQ